LGVDYGLKRIGLATCDGSGFVSSPFDVIKNKGDNKNIARLLEIIHNERIEGVVIGLPLDKDGNETKMSGLIRGFAQKLSDKSGVMVMFINERYSSQEATEHIREKLGIKSREKIKELVDKMAAAMLLQTYLDNQKKGVVK